jgi:hypothetical protein
MSGSPICLHRFPARLLQSSEDLRSRAKHVDRPLTQQKQLRSDTQYILAMRYHDNSLAALAKIEQGFQQSLLADFVEV